MGRILAIELENFQSIETRTRIELKPITLMFGPNSAGKSAIFDAIELLRHTLDPDAFDEDKLYEMIDRWARRKNEERSHDGSEVRDTFLAIEFEMALPDYNYCDFRSGYADSSELTRPLGTL